MMDKDLEQVRKVLESYVSGCFHADPERLGRIFDKGATMSGVVGGERYRLSGKDFIDSLAREESMAAGGIDYDGRIESIHIMGDIARAVIREYRFMGSRDYLSCFHMIRSGEEWLITDKLFTGI